MLNLKTTTIIALATVALSGAVSITSTTAFAGETPATASVAENQTIASGRFEGRSDHITSGGVSIVKTATGYQLVLDADFELDGAPDPILGFGNNGEFVKSTKISSLNSKTGAQSYQLPEGFVPGQYTEAYVFCEKFSVPLGVATLN